MDRITRFISDHAILVLVAVAALTVLAANAIVDLRTGVSGLQLDTSIDTLLPAGDEDAEFYKYVRRVFGSDETLMIGFVTPDDVFTPENLRRLERITDRVQYVEGVHHVVSLANALNIRSDGNDLVVEPFLETIPEDPEALEALRQEALDNPLLASGLLSADGRSAAIIVYMLDILESDFIEKNIDGQIRAIAEEEAGDARILLTGSLHVKAETGRILIKDLSRTIPLFLLVASAVAFLAFRSVRAVVVAMTTITVALVWTLGVIATLGVKLNLVTIVVPILSLVIGFAYAIHIVAAYYEAVRSRSSGDRKAVMLEAMRQVSLPTLLTGATTAAGFLSLATSPLGAIKEFGVFATLGVLSTMVAVLTLAPSMLQILPLPKSERRRSGGGRVDRLLIAVADFDMRNRIAILATGGLIAVLALLATTRINVSTDFITTFPKQSQVRANFEEINEIFGGSGTVNVILSSSSQNAFKEPVNLRHMRDFQRWLESQPEIGATTSLVDYVMLINRGFNGNDPEFFEIPESKRMVTQLLFFGANDEIENFVNSRYETVNVLARTTSGDSGDTAALADRIEEHLATLPEHLEGRVTGNTVLVARTMDDIAWGQAVSLLSAFTIIFIILALLFTSARVGFIALIPNILPVLVYFGILGITGVTLNTTTGLVACLVLGIAVDDTIHYLSHFNSEAKRKADERQGVIDALLHVGRPITFTSIALCLGFLVMVTAEIRSQVEFGALASVTLAFAWLVDVTFTPAIAARMRIVTLWDVLSLDLGESPQDSIRLFSGLSKTQARISALMTSMRSFPKGHRLMQLGDEGDEMYVVVDGELVASIPGEEGGRVQLNVSKRGDVVGEVAFFHGGRRTADVEALTDVRLIRLTRNNLERLRRRYPRIGAQLYRNLSEILASRLVRATERLR
ncbi:MAG: efflux RND transporter permease subunit [Proteobacteria bacterium]|nr:efflux RND transporter permease subunit [Pseudomonadota bacterium]